MAEVNSTTWTCDRCERQELCTNRNQPEDWITVRYLQPPRSAEPHQVGHLCPDCWDQFGKWWGSGKGE